MQGEAGAPAALPAEYDDPVHRSGHRARGRIPGSFRLRRVSRAREWTSREEPRGRLDALFRLGFTGDRRSWSYALFTWSNEGYAPSFGASGSFTATPELAFDSAANLYLG
jgi:hypothetical protein